MATIVHGDLVCLNSGGPPMTVDEIHDDQLKCLWFNDDGVLVSKTFHEDSVVLFEELLEADEEEGEDEMVLLDDEE